MATILLSSITIAMETTYLNESIPLFFMACDIAYLGVFLAEFLLKVSFVATMHVHANCNGGKESVIEHMCIVEVKRGL